MAAKKTSIVHQLNRGMVALVLLLILSTLVALASFWSLHQLQQQMVERQLLSLLRSRALAVNSTRLVALSNRLIEIRSTEDLSRLTSKFRHYYTKLDLLLEETMELELPEIVVTNSSSALENLQGNLVEAENAIKLKIEKRNDFNEKYVTLLALHSAINELVEPVAIDSDLLFFNIADQLITYSLDRVDYHSLAPPIVDKLVRAYKQQALIREIVFLLDVTKKDLQSLVIANEREVVDSLKNSINLKVRKLTQIALGVRALEKKKIATLINQLFELTLLRGNIFDIKQQLIDVNGSIYAHDEKMSQYIDKLNSQSDIIGRFIERQSQIDKTNIESKTLLLSGLLLAILVICLLCYGYIIRQLLFTKVARPILQLANATKRLSSGDREVTLRDYSSIEFSEMGSALTIFKKNSEKLTRQRIELEKNNADLKRANEDLEDFAYAASHDLKSPLRGISNLVSFMKDDLGGSVNFGMLKNLDLINGRIARLEILLDDLLAYSRANQYDRKAGTRPLPQFFEDTLFLLNVDGRFSLNIVSNENEIHTILTPLSQVVRNIFDNAIKHHDKHRGQISVTVELVAERYYITIEDDGPGIAPEYHKKIFGLFQTLRPRDQVEGSGIGLSMVEKVINSMGGEIHIKPNPGNRRGTSLQFDWPYLGNEDTYSARS